MSNHPARVPLGAVLKWVPLAVGTHRQPPFPSGGFILVQPSTEISVLAARIRPLSYYLIQPEDGDQDGGAMILSEQAAGSSSDETLGE